MQRLTINFYFTVIPVTKMIFQSRNFFHKYLVQFPVSILSTQALWWATDLFDPALVCTHLQYCCFPWVGLMVQFRITFGLLLFSHVVRVLALLLQCFLKKLFLFYLANLGVQNVTIIRRQNNDIFNMDSQKCCTQCWHF